MHIHNNSVLHYLYNVAVGLVIYSKARAFKAKSQVLCVFALCFYILYFEWFFSFSLSNYHQCRHFVIVAFLPPCLLAFSRTLAIACLLSKSWRPRSAKAKKFGLKAKAKPRINFHGWEWSQCKCNNIITNTTTTGEKKSCKWVDDSSTRRDETSAATPSVYRSSQVTYRLRARCVWRQQYRRTPRSHEHTHVHILHIGLTL